MSSISVNVHGLVDLSAVSKIGGEECSWVTMGFRTEHGDTFEITSFIRGDKHGEKATALTDAINSVRMLAPDKIEPATDRITDVNSIAF